MSATVKTTLLVAQPEENMLTQLFENLLSEGWAVPERGGRFTYLIDQHRRETDDVEEIVTERSLSSSAAVSVKRNETTVWLETNQEPVGIRKHDTNERTRADPLTSLQLWSWESEFKPPRGGWNGRRRDAASRTYVDAVATATAALTPEYGYGSYPDELSAQRTPTDEDVREGRPPDVFWVNVFGPAAIETIGRERIETAPAWLLRDIDNEHVLMVTMDNPVRPSEGYRDRRGCVRAHLGA